MRKPTIMKKNILINEGKALVSKLWCDGDLRQNIGQAIAAIGGFQRLRYSPPIHAISRFSSALSTQ